jgi:transposase
MIALPANTRIWIAAGVTDMRRGFTGLSALVQTALEQDPLSGHVFAFRGRRGDLIKLLWWDGDGLCLFAKRLERGRFIWPKAESGTVSLTRAQLSMLCEGIDWRRPVRTAESLMAIEHLMKLCCTGCDAIVQAAAPSRPIERGLAGPGLLAHILTAKYCDHLPLHRQSGMYAREGVDLDDSTLADWVGASSRLLQPLVEVLRRYVMDCNKLHADDTPVPVLAPGNGKTKTGRLWTYVRDDRPAGSPAAPAMWFAYSPDRKGEHPQQHLSKFTGILQADGYAGFNQIYESGRVQEAACWAHVRRKFYDLKEAHKSPIATEAVERIAPLYGIEEEIRGRSRGGERAATFYSLIGTAKLNGLNPEWYLRHVLENIADHPFNRIEELLPWKVTANLQPETHPVK